MRRYIFITRVIALCIPVLIGCQKADSTDIRRARLVANENLQLKKDLQEKDQQIESLKQEIERIESESAEKVERAGETSIKSMRLLLESEQRAEELLIENRKLNEELEKLKGQ
jgi:hypothetical protein